MECTIFSSLTHHAGIKAAIVCVALLDRLKGDQVSQIHNLKQLHEPPYYDCSFNFQIPLFNSLF